MLYMISILMPIYNGINFIDESVSSVLRQTYSEWELIIGINGHPPNSNVYQIAKKYELTNNKIKVFDYIDIKGKSNTLNEMLKECAGDYVALLDVDDIWRDNKLKIQSCKMNVYDVIGSRCVYFGDLNGIIPAIPVGDIGHFDFTSVNPIINSSSLIRKQLCYWNPIFIEDYDLWLRLKKGGHTFFNFSEILVKHRIHTDSAFNSKGNNLSVPQLLAIHNNL
jgi:teichuronic acid biosynthesis glycosyltransferase TuaG